MKKLEDWRDIEYLQSGTSRQRAVHGCLTKHRLLEHLSEFDPILVSTVCLDIDVAGSDLDIICCSPNTLRFEEVLRNLYRGMPRFSLRRRQDNTNTIVCSFFLDDFEIELFGCSIPVEEQAAYRHLLATARLLALSNGAIREKIRGLKLSGLKTEPAIAKILGLEGDPYQRVSELSHWPDSELKNLLHKACGQNEQD